MWNILLSAGWRPRRGAETLRSSLRAQAVLRPGSDPSNAIPVLNPRFLAWLMGWPPEGTDSEVPATAFAPWLRRMRTALSELPSPEWVER